MKKLFTIFILFSATTLFAQTRSAKDIAAFIPKGYVLFEQRRACR